MSDQDKDLLFEKIGPPILAVSAIAASIIIAFPVALVIVSTVICTAISAA